MFGGQIVLSFGGQVVLSFGQVFGGQIVLGFGGQIGVLNKFFIQSPGNALGSQTATKKCSRKSATKKWSIKSDSHLNKKNILLLACNKTAAVTVVPVSRPSLGGWCRELFSQPRFPGVRATTSQIPVCIHSPLLQCLLSITKYSMFIQHAIFQPHHSLKSSSFFFLMLRPNPCPHYHCISIFWSILLAVSLNLSITFLKFLICPNNSIVSLKYFTSYCHQQWYVLTFVNM